MYAKEYSRIYRLKNLEHIRERERKYFAKRKQNPEWIAKKKLYMQKYWKRKWAEYKAKYNIRDRIDLGLGKKSGSKLKKKWLYRLLKEGVEKRCVTCGDEKNLSINNKIPKCIGEEESIENLEIMCNPCNKKVWWKLVKTALKFYFDNHRKYDAIIS